MKHNARMKYQLSCSLADVVLEHTIMSRPLNMLLCHEVQEHRPG